MVESRAEFSLWHPKLKTTTKSHRHLSTLCRQTFWWPQLLNLDMVGRLPVQGISSPNPRCRCTHVVCPQSRRMTAAGLCCRQSCSCMSPRLLERQADISQPLLPDHAPTGNQASISTNTQGCTDHSGDLGKPGICIGLGWWRLSWCYFIPHPKRRKRICPCLHTGGSVHCDKTMASQVTQISMKTLWLSGWWGRSSTHSFLLFWDNGNTICNF